ncbi:methylated-DNA--[protein]-cysteine S-methyltransferase [Paenibacillus piri]|uniref:methylated-DNA--[protein]-cysteine S-methyltransferase n=1 Tax=Paenibacillus piri TaxID=2547395 RepID=A0A4V2ZUF6_9BACL|nr:methylated-DNA--[protein]-cysteine S-methyltransferase [Paenibacillus piri]TDG00755.1 methylated-DNA--[protein]-cysteine S-methyltransferase [Paenibacillus piri]
METKIKGTIYWSVFVHDEWKLHIAATQKGLCYVGSPVKPFEEMAAWADNRFPGWAWTRDDALLQPYAAELRDYFRGGCQSFTLPVDCRGTSFQLAVWKALGEIPYGNTRSYSEIARHISRPASVRAVGAAIGANPVLIAVPCHRVIGKNGSLTGYRGGLEMKTKLLRLEREGMSAREDIPAEGSARHA